MNGGVRQLKNCTNGRAGNGSDHGGQSSRNVSTRLADSITGEFGELAVAKHFGFYHTRGGAPVSFGDVQSLEVKTTERDNGGLILHKSDPDSPHILVRINISRLRCEIVGWWPNSISPGEKFWREDFDPPAWLLPARKLRSITTLQGKLQAS